MQNTSLAPVITAALVSGVTLIGAVALIGGALYLAIQNENEWGEFAAKHQCKVIEKIRGSAMAGQGVTSTGQMGTVISVAPSKTGYLCDDGVTYWR